VLVGAYGASMDVIRAAGHAYLFDGETGNLLMDLANPEPTQGAAFGWSVSATENRILVGALLANSEEALESGAVYVYEAVPEPTTWLMAMAGVAGVVVMRARRGSRRG
jgi:FG-GAP repeat protein/PEP-CTERM motif-containing protein